MLEKTSETLKRLRMQEDICLICFCLTELCLMGTGIITTLFFFMTENVFTMLRYLTAGQLFFQMFHTIIRWLLR